jgi:hypothetical protein
LKDKWDLGARGIRARGLLETTQENMQDWLELDEGDLDFSF